MMFFSVSITSKLSKKWYDSSAPGTFPFFFNHNSSGRKGNEKFSVTYTCWISHSGSELHHQRTLQEAAWHYGLWPPGKSGWQGYFHPHESDQAPHQRLQPSKEVRRKTRETLHKRKMYIHKTRMYSWENNFFSLAHVPSVNMEGTGFMNVLQPATRGRSGIFFWLHFWGAVMTSILLTVNGFDWTDQL